MLFWGSDFNELRRNGGWELFANKMPWNECRAAVDEGGTQPLLHPQRKRFWDPRPLDHKKPQSCGSRKHTSPRRSLGVGWVWPLRLLPRGSPAGSRAARDDCRLRHPVPQLCFKKATPRPWQSSSPSHGSAFAAAPPLREGRCLGALWCSVGLPCELIKLQVFQ